MATTGGPTGAVLGYMSPGPEVTRSTRYYRDKSWHTEERYHKFARFVAPPFTSVRVAVENLPTSQNRFLWLSPAPRLEIEY